MDLKKTAERLQEIKVLKEQISSCKNDSQAILLQQKIIDILQEVFGDKEALANIALINQKKNKKE